MFGRVWSLIWKEPLQFWRYKLILIFVLVFPIWNLTSVTDMVARGIMHIPTAVYDQDSSSASRRLASLLPALTLIREREVGTLEQLLVAPLRSLELVVGKNLLNLTITFLVFIEMLALIVFYYQVPMRGSLVLLLLLTGYYIFVEMGWGLPISAVARTQGQGFLGAFIIVILEIILSGQILPVEYIPSVAQAAAYFMPNKHYNTIVRGIMLKGYSLADVWLEVAILGVAGVILYSLVLRRLRKGLE